MLLVCNFKERGRQTKTNITGSQSVSLKYRPKNTWSHYTDLGGKTITNKNSNQQLIFQSVLTLCVCVCVPWVSLSQKKNCHPQLTQHSFSYPTLSDVLRFILDPWLPPPANQQQDGNAGDSRCSQWHEGIHHVTKPRVLQQEVQMASMQMTLHLQYR